jgi:spore coat assemly protein
MKIGDIVVRKSYGKDVTFKIIDINNDVYTIKGINLRIIADAPMEDLEELRSSNLNKNEKNYDRRINRSIRRILVERENVEGEFRSEKISTSKGLIFGRPGKILHIDGDEDYLDTCLKVYSQLSLDAVGRTIPEKDQPLMITDLVKEIKPDIVVLTGHDAISKNIKDYMDLANYKNSQYFVKAVSMLRNYESSYDDLVIFAGACQSCYEAILDAGAYYTKLR